METQRILVVEDNAAIREMIAEILTGEAYIVEQAANGCEALLKLKYVRPDAILLDLMMPMMDGPTFVKACGASIPMVIMSASPNLASSANLLREYGVRAALAKPFDVDALVSVMEQVTSRSAADSCSPP